MTCYTGLMKWMDQKQTQMRFGAPMIWTDPGAHNPNNCYPCRNFVRGMNVKNTKSKEYFAVPSAQRPLPHSDIIPVPNAPTPDRVTAVTATTGPQEETPDYTFYDPGEGASNQPNLDFIVSKLELSQRKAETLASFLKENNLLAPGTKITAYRSRQKSLQECFMTGLDKTYAYCHDVEKLMQAMGIVYKAEDWRLFIDSSKNSLKAVLLHKTNSKPSVPIAYNTETEETYDKIRTILRLVDYDKHKWRICCDLKMVAILCGLQTGYTKYMCFLCKWDSRYKGNQYQTYSWQNRDKHVLHEFNVENEALVPRESILLPYLHVKLGIVKNFIKAVVGNKKNRRHAASVLQLLREDVFKKKISESKLRGGVVNGPDIRKLIKDERFDAILKPSQRRAWSAVKKVIKGYLGKHRSPEYDTEITEMLGYFSKIGVNMSLKIHFLHHHLEYFEDQAPTESDEQGERFHQTAIPFEIRYRGKRSPDDIMAEICLWCKNLFEETEEQGEPMEVDDGNAQEDAREADRFADFIADSDDDDFDEEEEEGEGESEGDGEEEEEEGQELEEEEEEVEVGEEVEVEEEAAAAVAPPPKKRAK
ncbi:uncharacterized protein LOC129571793 [Sitodiplosis mosellana]|uniref:uncharacterized protein LOC129571793 n=1 Tax=Sitodiplosis mosellana TaxID=263140 RepID=UPI002443C649|nr:uncharacterized protein LOC129571793 [Sitodiplosis mosellana]